MAMKRKYPVGIQSFESLRMGGYVYVDKTPLIYKMITEELFPTAKPNIIGSSEHTRSAHKESKLPSFADKRNMAIKSRKHIHRKHKNESKIDFQD